ncbi:MAG: hypothetical protein WBB40_00555 [Psychrobacter alimentarius]
MNKNFESIIQSPIMKMASANQARLDSMAAATESAISFSKLTDNLDPSQRWKGYLVTEGFLSKLYETFPQNSLVINDNIAERLKILTELTHFHTPLSESVNLNKTLLQAFEATHLGLKPPTQFIFPEGAFPQKQFGDISTIMSKATEAFRQLESLSNLESFKAISRLKNFPNDKIWTQDYDKGYEVTEDFLAEVKTIDARISDEISSVDDFNELSESSKNSLEKLNLSYYQIFIIYYIYCITILREQISNSLKYSDMEFKFVGWSSKVLVGICFIGFQPDFNSICNSIVATILLDNLKQDGKK